MKKGLKIILLIVALAILVLVGYFIKSIKERGAVKSGVACTMEAKLCPDGSAVGRVGPNCDFSPCPQELFDPNGWLTFTDQEQKIRFKYPRQLIADFISPQDWPPQVLISTENFTCTTTPETSSLPNRVIKRLVDDRAYCVSAMSEGAAGTTYTEYNYTTKKDGNLVIVQFTLRYPQCLNYDDPQQTACVKEREAFDLDSLVDRIVNSISSID